MISLVKLLTEVSLEQLKCDWVDSGKVSPEFFSFIYRCTNQKSAYTTWFLKRIYERESLFITWKNLFRGERFHIEKDWSQTFKDFEKYKQYIPIKDINRFDSILNFKMAVKAGKQEYIDRKAKKDISRFKIGSVEVKSKNTTYDVYKLPKGHEENKLISVALGRCPEDYAGWCTAYDGETDNHYWENYINRGDLYIFVNPKDRLRDKFQLQYETEESRLVPIASDKPLGDYESAFYTPFYDFLNEKEGRDYPEYVWWPKKEILQNKSLSEFTDSKGIYFINSKLCSSGFNWMRAFFEFFHFDSLDYETYLRIIRYRHNQFRDEPIRCIFFISTAKDGNYEDTRTFCVKHSGKIEEFLNFGRALYGNDVQEKIKDFVIIPEKDNNNPIFLQRLASTLTNPKFTVWYDESTELQFSQDILSKLPNLLKFLK